jgi:cytochrome P450
MKLEIESLTMQDLTRPEVLEDPYPLFRQMRLEDPIHQDPQGQGWMVTRYEDVSSVLSDRRFSAERLASNRNSEDRQDSVQAALSRQMLFLDPPDHTRLRGLFTKAFTPRRLELLRPQVVELVTDLLERVQRKGQSADFIADVAGPLPVIVIAQMLGVPREDWQEVRGWSGSFGRLISGRTLSPSESSQAQQGVLAFVDYFGRLIEERRTNPQNDMLSDLITVEELGDKLSKQELIVNLILLFAAGHGTTTHLLGNGLLALLRNPSEWRLLVEDESLAPTAVNELLRYDAPVQATSREALEDVELGGKTILKGSRVTVFLGSSNRDAEQFEKPNDLQIKRTRPRIVSFGHGIHTCLGAALARLEAQVVFVELTQRFPHTQLVGNVFGRLPSFTFRGVSSLPVMLR